MEKHITSEQLQDYLDAWDKETQRPPYCKGKVDKEREAVRKQIEELKKKESLTPHL